MAGTHDPDSHSTDEPAGSTDVSAAAEPAEETAKESPPEAEGEMIRSPSQELAAIPDEPSEAVAQEPATDWEAQAEKTRNQLLRVAADFENYKKRSKRDLQDAAFRARDEVLQELLPVFDNLERAISHADQSAECVDAGTLLEGVRMVLRQFEGSMEKFGVKGFDSVGQPFDPNFHEALQQRESDAVPPGHVLEEYRKGYLMGERLVRPAMVVVATAPADNGKGSTDAGGPASTDQGDEPAEPDRSGKDAGGEAAGEERSGE